MCTMPELRKAALVASEMPPRSPVISALAMAPVSPGSAAVMRCADGAAQPLDARPQRASPSGGGAGSRHRASGADHV